MDISEQTLSVVIPTSGRPQMLARALRSVFNQTLAPMEIIVVFDGPQTTDSEELELALHHPLLRVMRLEEQQGGAVARNAGIAAANGHWIALLDDDDEWLPRKLELQMRVVQGSDIWNVLITGKVRVHTPSADYIWPRRPPGLTEPISEYLFVRRGLFTGETYLPTPTFVAPKKLFSKIPFSPHLRRHQDWDWVLRAVTQAGSKIIFVNEPLAIVNFEENRPSVSQLGGWKYSRDWAINNQDLFTKRALSSFILISVSSLAVRDKDFSAFFKLLRLSLQQGKPRLKDFLIYLSIWLVPRSIRRRIRASFKSLKHVE